MFYMQVTLEKLEKMQKEAQETVKQQEKEEQQMAAQQDRGGFSWWPNGSSDVLFIV